MGIDAEFVIDGQKLFKLSEVPLHGIGYHGNAPNVKDDGIMNLKIKKSGN